VRGGIDIHWELSRESDAGVFRLIRSRAGGGEREIDWEMSAPGRFVAGDRDPLLRRGGSFRYTLHARASGEFWRVLRSETVELPALPRVTALFGVGKTIRINDQLIGTDKLGHFISQGRKYYRRFIRYGSEARAAEQSAATERTIFGQLANGIYSNADLVANYEGHRFYRSLFEDDIIDGKPAILRWENDDWVVQREFDWADHVNEYWDEALNVNYFDAGLYKHMHRTLISYCPQYWQEPSLYTIVNEQRLKERYAFLRLHDNSELRLDSLCPVQVFLETGVIPEEKSSLGARASP